MKTMKGNLLDLAEQGTFDIIAHGCNCFCTMKSGIAGEIAKRYPHIALVDLFTERGDVSKLGTYSNDYVWNEDYYFEVYNMYTQFKYGRDKNIRYVDYDAVQECFKNLAHELKCLHKEDRRIGIPKIGAGLANGRWDIISCIIEEQMEGFDITVVEYEQGVLQ